MLSRATRDAIKRFTEINKPKSCSIEAIVVMYDFVTKLIKCNNDTTAWLS